MITFETKRHIEIDEGFQGINLTEFSIDTQHENKNDHIVDTFIRSSSFSIDSLRECVKKEPDSGYLKQALNIDKIKITDFKKYNKEETAKFLYDILNQPDWGDDRNEFAKLLDKYFEIHKQFGDNDFYLISKDWFDNGDERLIEPESWVYSYYFLLISVDRNSNLLTFTEWTYD